MEPKDPNVYVISLDAIDLNLLPSIYCTQDDKVVPLWKSSMDRRNDEYYRFEIKGTDGGKNKESSKVELENVICHICDIEVPKPFLIEHRKSSRHKTNLKISEIAIKRIQKHLNSTDDKNSSDIDKMDPSAYFCVTCVTIMDNKEKEAHEKSLSHKNSVMFEKIFQDFLILYDSHTDENDENDCTVDISEGNDSYTNACKESDCPTNEKIGNDVYISENNRSDLNSIENKGNTHSSEKREIYFYGSGCEFYTNKNNGNDSYSKRNDVITSENEGISKISMNINDSTSNLISKKPVNTLKKEIPPKEAMAKRVSANDYLSLLNRRKDGMMSFKLSSDSNTIEIETIDGSVVKVSEENFHGFNKVSRKHMQCFVCKEIFKGTAVEAHKMSEKHIKLMVAPLRDKHCARQIDDRLSHCLICNAVIKESDYHAVCDDDHCEYLKAALVSDKLTEDYGQYAAKCLTAHESNEDDSNKDSIDNYKENVEDDENIKENDNWIEVSKNNAKANIKETNIIPTKYFCASCNRFVYYSLKHNETANHIWNLKSDYHYLMKLKEDEVVCQVCKVPVTHDPDDLKVIKNHVHAKDHVEKFNQLLVDNKIERFKRHFYCKPCNKVILIKNEVKHMGEKRHKRFSAVKCNSELTVQQEIDRVSEQTDDDKTEINENQTEKMLLEFYVCNICNVNVPNYEKNIQEHMDGRTHAAKVKKNPLVTADQNEVTDINYQMELTKFPNVLNCVICKVYILHNELSVSEHLNHTVHKMNYNIFLKDNNLVLRNDNCYCNTCKAFVGVKNEILHAFGKRHIMKRKLELASLIELKNAKDKDIRNLKPYASNNIQKQNIASSSEFINEDKQNIATLSGSTYEDKQNIYAPSVSTNQDSAIEDKQNFATPSTSVKEDETNIATPSVSLNGNKQNIVTTLMSDLYDDTFPPYIFDENFPMLKDLYRHGAGPNVMSMMINYNKLRTDSDTIKGTPEDDTNVAKNINKEDETNIAAPSVSNNEDKQNIVTSLMSNLYDDTFPPFIFDDNFPDSDRLRNGPDIINNIPEYDPNMVKNINEEDETNIAAPSVSANEGKQNIVSELMSNLYDDTFPPFIFDENFPMFKDLYRHGAGPKVVSMIKNYNRLRTDSDTIKGTPDDDPNVAKNINKEDETNIATPSVSNNEDKQNIVTSLMSNLYADTFPPFIFDDNFPILKDLYRHGAGPNVESMIKEYNRLRTDPDTIKGITGRDPNMAKNINKEDETISVSTTESKQNIAKSFVSIKEDEPNIATSLSTSEEKQYIAPPSINEEKQNIAMSFVSIKEDDTNIATTSVSTNEEKHYIATPSANEEKQNIAMSFVSIKEEETNISRTLVSVQEDETNIATTSVSTNEEKQYIATPSANEEKQNIAMSFVSIKEDETNIATTSVSTNEEKQYIATPSANEEKQNIAMSFVSIKEDETNISMTLVSVKEDETNIATTSVSTNEEKQYIATPSANEEKQNIAMSFVSIKEDETNIATTSVSTNEEKQYIATPSANEEKQNIAMSFVSIKEDETNISMTLVSVKEDETNIATTSVYISEEKQYIATPSANEEKQNIATQFVSVKEDESNIPTTSVPMTNEDKRPCVDSCVSKVVSDIPDRDRNVNKNINILSVSDVKRVNASSLISKNDNNMLVLGKNLGLPVTMLELLEPTANSKEVICKICKVTVPYTKSNVSTHMNGFKHKNEHQKTLKGHTNYPDTSPVRDSKPSIYSNASKAMHDSNETKNINIPSVSNVKVNTGSLTCKSDVLVLGKNPGLPLLMLELLEPTAHSKIVICKICKVKVPYSKNNVSTHMNGSKHKNEHQKTLKGQIKYPNTSSVTDNRPCIDLNASKVIPDSNETKNINVPSISDIKKVNASSLISKSDLLVSGKNLGLPITMLELLEPTANTKEVICKICKVRIPYTKSNISSHMISSKHKNEHQKTLKANIELPDTSSVKDNRPCIDLYAPKDLNGGDFNVPENINIPSVSNVKVNTSSLTCKSDVLVLGKNPGLPVTMLELLEPTANSKIVICKICKVKVPYSKNNVSTHMNGSKHKNEHQKFLKGQIKYPDTSSVKDNKPCIDSNASKVMHDSNVTKNNINIPSVSDVKRVDANSLISKSDELVSGKNLGLPETMLELLLLEATADSKEVICKICKVKLTYNTINVSTHINGSNHKNALKKLLKAT